MNGMILLDVIDALLQLTKHLLNPSELTFLEWVFLIGLALSMISFFVILWKAVDVMEKNDAELRARGIRRPWW